MSSGKVEEFGKYHLLEKIANGGMAGVYRARAYGMAGFEKILVIKRILDHLAEDEEFIRLFIDEARIAVSLLHVNIVQVFELGEVDGHYFMAMEYVHGLDLARLASRAKKVGPFPIPIACFVVGEVLKALEFAHERTDEDGEPLRIVHCDISPANVLVSFAGEVKLGDFGISRAGFQAKSQHQVIRGKYSYMSPEQVGGKPLDGRSDLFSLAIVLYELVTGRRLFRAKKREETLARVRRAEVPSPRGFRSEVYEELEVFLLHALARKPEDRFQSAGKMLEELNAIKVREGHRVTNTDLSTYLKQVIEAAQGRATESAAVRREGGQALPPSPVVVMAMEASAPPRSIGKPTANLDELLEEWNNLVIQAGGEIWEEGDASMLAVWVARGGLRDALSRGVELADELQKVTTKFGYRLSVGVAPGVARLQAATKRPGEGWELAGPFYLARWLMNLSAHRGRILLTEVGARQVGKDTSLLGRIPIQGNRFINLYELSR
ncbi:MAG: serine/threonine-protein kinase [Myxococcota bacterium]|nr:serine/threonine-protein kinase [Myxococcota bacterium]